MGLPAENSQPPRSTEIESMARSISSRFVLAVAAAALFLWSSCPGVARASGPRGQPGLRMGFAAPMYAQGGNRSLEARPAPNSGHPAAGGGRPGPNSMARPGGMGAPHRPEAQQHLNEWMYVHRNLSPEQQHSALEAEPGFRQLRPEEQQRMHNLVTRLNSMSPEQRQRTIARTEWMEHLAPQQRQQVRSAMAQLGSLPPDRSYAVGRAFRSIEAMPPVERQAYMDSPQFRGQFNDQERGTLNNLLSVSPLLPPANLGAGR